MSSDLPHAADAPIKRQPAGTCPDCGCARATVSWEHGLICATCSTPWPMVGGHQ